jgi:hypothetical protein
MTNERRRDGHRWYRISYRQLSVHALALRRKLEHVDAVTGGCMEYVLLAYGRAPSTPGPIDDPIAELLDRPHVTGWARLHADESATTLRNDDNARTLLTDGPFVDSKEYLIGLIMIEADNLDGALAIAQELQDARAGGGAMEVRPVFESQFRGT